MHKRFAFTTILSILLLSCFENSNGNGQSTAQSTDLSLTPAFDNKQFNNPLAAVQAENKDWFVVEQGGRIYRIENTTHNKTGFLDISNKVKSGGEMGLLGLALDPEFTSNGIFYVSYTNNDDYSIIGRYKSKNNVADPDSEEVILRIAQPFANHNGGHIVFGPDGFLYVGFGDGGAAGDPLDNAQNIETLLGTVLRIDVRNQASYAIPDDNPFVNQAGKDEIFAYGLRNPWRFSFDTQSGELWAADVGQNAWEEIDIIIKGGNYGWNIMEGSHCFTVGPCEPEKYIAPVFDYARNKGKSVTGGYVYRGEKIPELQGYYIYGDYVSGNVWALKRRENSTPENLLLFESDKNISSFAQDRSGEIYVIDHNGGVYAITKP